MAPQISIIVAVANNDVIGADGDMPWRLSTDLKRFKALTVGKPIIMGRKTFMSIGKALPGRTNIVVTRDADWQFDGAVPVASFDLALALAEQCPGGDDEICVVGGGQIYAIAMEKADILHVTHVDAEPVGDTLFPKIDSNIWTQKHSETVPIGEKDTAKTTYSIYERASR